MFAAKCQQLAVGRGELLAARASSIPTIRLAKINLAADLTTWTAGMSRYDERRVKHQILHYYLMVLECKKNILETAWAVFSSVFTFLLIGQSLSRRPYTHKSILFQFSSYLLCVLQLYEDHFGNI